METIIVIAVLIISIILHEVAHGYAANWLGDPTARLAGRLTLNPVSHVDPIGSVVIPAMLYLSSAGFMFGWAKPVPYNPYNLNNQKWGEAFVAFAGPGTNFLLAIIFAALINLRGVLGLDASFLELASTIVFMNVFLGMFNLIPFPPLDGSKVIEPFLPRGLAMRYRALGDSLSRFGIMGSVLILTVFVFVLANPFFYLVKTVTEFIMNIGYL
jgi:Zn-dependent protease